MNEPVNKKVLVTGGAGFIGHHLVKRLTKKNEVHVLDDLSAGKRENLEGVECVFHEASILDDSLNDLFKRGDFDLTFHLAASRLDVSLTDQVRDFQVNALGTVRVCQAAKESGVERLVFSSTGSVYGEPKQAGHNEEHELQPSTPYGTSKACADHYAQLYNDFLGLNTVRLRYYNVYGPGRLAGSVPQFINRALKGDEIIIQGGKQTRSLTFVDDIVDATLHAGVARGIEGEAFNVSGPKPTTVKELAELIVDLCGGKARFKYAGYRPGEIMVLEPDISKITRVMGWTPKTSLEAGLARSIEWMKRVNPEVVPLPPTHKEEELK